MMGSDSKTANALLEAVEKAYSKRDKVPAEEVAKYLSTGYKVAWEVVEPILPQPTDEDIQCLKERD